MRDSWRFLAWFTVNMDLSLERDSSALGSLFQQIINDMKVSVIDLLNSFKAISLSFVESVCRNGSWENYLEKQLGKATVEFPHELYLLLSFRIGFCLFFQWKTREIESFVLVFFLFRSKWTGHVLQVRKLFHLRLSQLYKPSWEISNDNKNLFFVLEILYRVFGFWVSDPGSRSVSRTFGLMLGSNSLYAVMPRPNLRAL